MHFKDKARNSFETEQTQRKNIFQNEALRSKPARPPGPVPSIDGALEAGGTDVPFTPPMLLALQLLCSLSLAAPAATTPPTGPRAFLADGLLEFTYPIASPTLATLHVNQSTATGPGVEITRRKVVMAAGGRLGPATVPHPELLAHGPLTVYFQPLDGEMRRRRARRRLQDAVPANADALSAPVHGSVCDGKPGLRCTVFEAPIVYGAIGDGAARRTFLYYQDVGSIGPLLDAAQQLPEPILSVNTWSRPFGLGWQLPHPAIPITLKSNLTISDAYLMITDELPKVSALQYMYAILFLKCTDNVLWNCR